MSDPVHDFNSDDRPVAVSSRARWLEGFLTNPFWTVVILSGAGFAVTCLASVAATMGDPQSPMNKLVTSYGTAAVTWEAAILIVSGLLAMTLDRIQTLRRDADKSSRLSAGETGDHH